jgi:flagellar protein FliO/FliZ
MPDSFGIGSLMLLIVVAAVICGAIYALRTRMLPRRLDVSDEEPMPARQGRIAVLESTPLDGTRRLLLVRCDNIEHLIMVGGPADLVVENDVRKSRAPKPLVKAEEAAPAARRAEAAAARPAGPEPKAALPAPLMEPAELQPSPPVEARQPEPKRPAPPAEAAERGPRPNLSAVPPAAAQHAGRSAPATAQPPARQGGGGEQQRPAKHRQQTGEPQIARREAPAVPAQQRPTQVQPAAASAGRAQPPAGREAPERRGKPNREAEPAPRPPHVAAPLPAAQVPWPEAERTDSEDVSRPDAPAARPQAARAAPAAAQKQTADPATTLGDLAERLEEALAREVQSAHPGKRGMDPDLDAFGLDQEPEPYSAPEQPSQPQRRAAPEPRPAARAMNAAPEPEARRDSRAQPDRQDEAPVISLNARRREAVDPLEDEMARLLGELTGDTNRR